MARTKKKAEPIDELIDEMEVSEEMLMLEVEKNKMRLNPNELIPSGSTLLDIAVTNTTHGCYLTGKYYHLVGGSTSGKTMAMLHAIANIVNNPKYDDYDIFVDEPEDGCEVDIEEMFGPVTASRLKAPNYDKGGDAIHSVTVEDFYDTVQKKNDICESTGKKFFYFLDSMDSLTSEADIKKMEENMELRDADKETGGSFGMGKASVNSKRLGMCRNNLKRNDCTLFIISQERDDIRPMAHGGATYSGGKALKFYADLQLWFKGVGEITTTIDGNTYPVGNKAIVNITKNRLSGQKHKKIPIEISFNYGMDNIGPCIDKVIQFGFWKKGTSIDTGSYFGEPIKKVKNGLAIWIDNNDKEEALIKLVSKLHNDVQSKIKDKFKRNKRYK